MRGFKRWMRAAALVLCAALVLAGVPAVADQADTWTDFIVIPIKDGTEAQLVHCYGGAQDVDIVLPETYSYNGQEIPITEIASDAFFYVSCNTLSIPKSVKKIRARAFRNAHVTAFSVDSGNESYRSVDGVLFTADGRELVAYPASAGALQYDIPAGTEKLLSWSFNSAEKLKQVNLPDSVRVIGSYAFSECYNLFGVSIPEGLAEIEEGAFSRCNNMHSIYLPGSVTSVAEDIIDSGDVVVLTCENSPAADVLDVRVTDRITGISATPDRDTFTEKTQGNYREDNGVQWFEYHPPAYSITVTFENSEPAVFSNESAFYDAYGFWPDTYSDQSAEAPWEVGEHEFYVSVFGLSAAIPVTIRENNIQSVEILPLQIIENTNGYLERDSQGVEYYRYHLRNLISVRITYKDATTEVCTLEEYCGRIEQGYEIDDNQRAEHWGLGTHTVKVYFNGETREFPVEIIPNPYISMEILSVPREDYLPYERIWINGTRVCLHTSENPDTDEPLEIEIFAPIQYFSYGAATSGGVEFTYFMNDSGELEMSCFESVSAVYPLSVDSRGVESAELLTDPLDFEGRGAEVRVTYSGGEQKDFTFHRVVSGAGRGNETTAILTSFVIAEDRIFDLESEIRYDESRLFLKFCGQSVEVTGEVFDRLETEDLTSQFALQCLLPGVEFTGTLTAENIQVIAAFSAAHGGAEPFETGVEEAMGYCDKYSGEDMRAAIAKCFSIDAPDLSLSPYYDAENDVFVLYNWGMGAFIEKESILVREVSETTASFEYMWRIEGLEQMACAVTVENGRIAALSPFISRGDANGDRELDVRDLVRMKKALAGAAEIAYTVLAADLSGDGRLEAPDLSMMRHVLISSER